MNRAVCKMTSRLHESACFKQKEARAEHMDQMEPLSQQRQRRVAAAVVLDFIDPLRRSLVEQLLDSRTFFLKKLIAIIILVVIKFLVR